MRLNALLKDVLCLRGEKPADNALKYSIVRFRTRQSSRDIRRPQVTNQSTRADLVSGKELDILFGMRVARYSNWYSKAQERTVRNVS